MSSSNSRKGGRTFGDVLSEIRSSRNTVEIGTKFEHLIKNYFKTDPLRTKEFSKVWLWKEDACPGKGALEKIHKKRTKKDHGIDLVAQRFDGTLCAIQCKCYERSRKLAENDVSNFLALASAKSGTKRVFDSSIFVWTGHDITLGAAGLLEGHGCEVLDYYKLKKSSVDWPSLLGGKPKRLDKFELRPHQKRAVDKVASGFLKGDRGKLVMACGTGKTFVTLKVAERQAGRGCAVLYLVPSISLLQQSMREWAEQAGMPHRYVAVCSDTKVGKDDEDASLSELEIVPTTDPKKIAGALAKNSDYMLVVFSTYQSIMQVSKAQKARNVEFDLVVCDEAHRTTGIINQELRPDSRVSDSDDSRISSFVAIHSQDNIRAKKRLYVTATPKIYASASRKKAEEGYGVETYSMDDHSTYGSDFYRLTFDEAITQKLLTDYKVVIMTVEEDSVIGITQKAADRGDALNISKVAQWIGCWKGLKNPDKKNPREPANPLQRAIAFTQSIANSKRFAHSFSVITGHVSGNGSAVCATEHVDGSQNALNRREKINWLEESNTARNECRILSNARCLSEGVDVPALDAVIFLNPRESIIDVIQAVGRIMRRSDGKDYGYVILPVAIPVGIDPKKILDDHKTYKVVWNVLRALRAHDSRRFEQRFIDGDIMSDMIIWNPPEPCSDCHAGICDKHKPRPPCQNCEQEFEGGDRCAQHSPDPVIDVPAHLIHSKIVEQLSDRRYLESWAEDVAEIVGRVTARIQVLKKNARISAELDEFHAGLKKVINDTITEEESLDMLAQHMVMGRVFDALFRNDAFTRNNPVAKTMDQVLESLRRSGLESEMEKLQGFYSDVEDRVKDIGTDEGRQQVIHELFDKFFNHAFKKTATRLGIVYTPIEVVDFILRSTNLLLQKHFGTDLSDKNVNVIDPFVGTGSFLTRLMSSDLGLIKDKDLLYKYRNSLYAGEIVLLAYYIAAVNCESTFLDRAKKYIPFEGAALVDTFHQKNLTEEWKEGLFTEAQKRIEKQRKTQITVIATNPPYLAGQHKYGDQTQKTEYRDIDTRIKETYLHRSSVQRKAAAYDSYVRALRWASDRIGDSGIIGVITNARFLRSDVGAGIRASLAEEFNEIWCFDLRGNARTQGEPRKREGDGIFGEGSRAAVAITLLVKNPSMKGCTIKYKDIGNYLSKEQKMEIVSNAKSIDGIKDWMVIKPDRHYDWLDQRGNDFAKYTPIGTKAAKAGKDGRAVFITYSMGVTTTRDAWVYNSSTKELAKNMERHIVYCNSQDLKNPIMDPVQCKWSEELSDKLRRLGHLAVFDKNKIRVALYKPFFKQYLYFDPTFNGRRYLTPKIFPQNNTKNFVICIPHRFTDEMSIIITDVTPDLHIIAANQCFPLHTYKDGTKQENITDFALTEYCNHYGLNISKLDIFYYIYGLLHHPGYRKKFANNLMRELPHVPMAPDFVAFRDAGKSLADLHLDFETCARHDLGEPKFAPTRFSKLSFGRKETGEGDIRRHIPDRTVVRADGAVLFDDIPETTYRVNGRTPLEWIVDRYKVTTDKDSGITNDPCTGTDIVAVIERAVHVGLESERIINTLPEEFEPGPGWKPSSDGLDKYTKGGPYQSKI